MPAASLIVASLAALEPPRRPVAFFQTAWSLSASPQALAAAQEPRPIVGPGQARPAVAVPVAPSTAEKKRQVTVLPAAAEANEFEDLQDPAAPAAEAKPDGTAAISSPEATADIPAADAAQVDPAAADPFEEKLAKQIKPSFDPLEPINRISFSISQTIDRIVLRPVALTYYKVAPKPLRDGLRNVLAHWGAPIIAANDLLQLKPKRALKTIGRFLINTLLGLGGLFDVAREKKFNLPHHGNSFSNTLAFYGVKPGPYLYIPVLGPTTLLDQANRVQNYMPGIDYPLFRSGRGSVFGYLLGLEDRATNDQALKALLDDSVDPYATFRETWLQDRKGEIERLKAPDGVDPNGYQANPLDTPLEASPPVPSPADPTDPVAPTPVPAADSSADPALTPAL